MYKHEKGIQARYLEFIKKYTGIDTGIYTRRGVITFKQSSLFDHQVKVYLPDSFDENYTDREHYCFESEHHFKVDINNYDHTVCFTFHLIDNVLNDESAEQVIEDFYQILKRVNPDCTCLGRGHGIGVQLPYAWIEFTRNAAIEDWYQMLTAIPMQNRWLLMLFSCHYEEQSEWKHCLSEIREQILIE